MTETSAENYLANSQAYLLYQEYTRQAKDFEQAKQGPDGLAVYEQAMEAALMDEQRTGKDAWQPCYLLAKLLHSRQQFTLASSYLTRAFDHSSFLDSSEDDTAHARCLKDNIATALKRLRDKTMAASEEGRGGMEVSPSSPSARIGQRRLDINAALSPDILLKIIDYGRDDDPSLITRMSWVSRSIRRILVGQPSLWQRLVLGRGPRELAKVKAYLERCTGEGERGLIELTITEKYEWQDWMRVKIALANHVKTIERLTIDSGNADKLPDGWRHKMENLRYLSLGSSIDSESLIITDKLDFGLLPPDSSQLKELSLFHVHFEQEGIPAGHEETREAGSFFTNPTVQLANLTILRLVNCSLAWPVDDIRDILKDTPAIEEVYMDGVVWEISGFEDHGWQANEPVGMLPRLDNLARWSTTRGSLDTEYTGSFQFHSIHAPNLTHLEYEFDLDGLVGMEQLTSASGLVQAMPKLRYLSLSNFQNLNGLKAAMQKMKSLEYLHLRAMFDSENVDFFSLLSSSGKWAAPNLVALSLACKKGRVHGEITDGHKIVKSSDLRKWVNSRLDHSEHIPASVENPTSMSLPPTAIQTNPPTSTPIQSTLPLGIPPSSSLSSTSTSTPPPPVHPLPARLRYLNIDSCSKVDASLIPYLRERIAIVSHRMNMPKAERKMGRDRWDWEKLAQVD